MEDLDMPIALRRTPRNCVANPSSNSAAAAASSSLRQRVVSAPLPAILKTPSKPRPKKRVRFSDPGPDLTATDDALCSTGLTPMVKRSSLSEPSPKRRRASTGDKEVTTPKRNSSTKARARKRDNEEKVSAEIQRLRAELANRDAEIERLHNETLVQDTERILELEQQVETLRSELAQQQLPPLPQDEEDYNLFDGGNEYDLPSQSFYDWTMAPHDPFSDSCLDEDSNFTPMEIVCSTPSQRREKAGPSKGLSAPYITPPCTSPTLPATPCSARRTAPAMPATPQSHSGIQASLPDPEKEALELELTSLRLELTKLTETLDTHAALQIRLSEKLSTVSAPSLAAENSGDDQSELEARLDSAIQALSERTASLSELSASLTNLGFGGSDPREIVSEIAAGFRETRLELEYITPGEITLPLNSHAAEVLDLVLTRLRDLARKSHADDETIDEYHAIELSLRQQLSARFDAMKSLREEAKKNATTLRERDARIAELEIGLDRLKGAAEGYRRDIAELETLVQRLEGESESSSAKLNADLVRAETALSERGALIADLESKLSTTVAQAADLETKLKDLQRRKEAEAKVRNKSYSSALALRDARVLELRREIYDVNHSLRTAHEIIVKLRVENAGLTRRAEEAEEGTRLARQAVETMKAELEKATAAAPPSRRRTRSSTAKELATPRAGSSSVNGKGRRKRKCDSGLGLLDEDEDELDVLV
ncbi:hypothetical protein F5B22DRAFT_227923 [Xylaria bambusicola]|uniref:uncharacterized protein n=1 Tax=Xylaria bambusicola TaxID=326684 RepID=UPI0020089D83|nr:uncharacterized protein F5B22DRAFT_227923 [Xylaria bambusicola]KAI0514693.1 hypothetical protein F5B22DRAFT_227923 [Xylaria bambusicola]